MRVVEARLDLKVELYRGEDPTNVATLQRDGVQAKSRWLAASFPEPDWYNLARLDPAFLPVESAKFVRRHVAGQLRSPFVSFTTDPAVARRYALHQRQRGLLVAVAVRLVREWSWEGFLGPGWGLYQDDRARRWIQVGTYRAAGVEDLSFEKVRALGSRDREFLLVGDVEPSEFRLSLVQ